jgi:hypothetical protein
MTRCTFRLPVLLLAAWVLALAGCGGGGGPADEEAGPGEVEAAVEAEAGELPPGEAEAADGALESEEGGQDLPEAVEAEVGDAPDVVPEVSFPCDSDQDCFKVLGHPSDACTATHCDQQEGVCVFEVSPDLKPCAEPQPCLSQAVCVSGKCRTDLTRPRVCDDHDPCTDDQCVEDACVFTPSTSFCDDGNPCTTQDRCTQGACVGKPKAECACTEDSECAAFDDDDLCNGTLACVEGVCRPAPGSAPDCAAWDSPPCKVWACDPGSGACVLQNRPADAPCNDGNPCTLGEYCYFGECQGLNLCQCDDDGDCAIHDDGDACNGVPVCQSGRCVSPAAGWVECGSPFADGPCARRRCDPASGECVARAMPDGAPCLDLDACTKGETCLGGQCGGGGEPSCDDANPCTADFCEASAGCLHQFLDVACDDGNPCTQGEYCFTGQCIPKSLSSCHDGNPCTDDVCDASGGCTFVSNLQPCDDGNPCTGGDTCAEGACVPGEYACGECDGDLDCQEFDDANLCNGLLRCIGQACVVDPATVVHCDGSGDTACSQNLCDPAAAQCKLLPVNEGKPCDDADPCTVKDACHSGTCQGLPVVCDDHNPCTQDQCAADGGCVYLPGADPCDDANPCTGGDVCGGGACQPGATDLCAGTCEGNADCAAFDDGDPCNGLVTCQGGHCAFDPASVITCPTDGDTECRKNRCVAETGLCEIRALEDGTSCNDQDVCTSPDTCTSGFCSGPNVDCDDGNGCTADSCSMFYGCVHFNHTKACDDGDACTDGDRCGDALCISGPATDCDDLNVCTLDSCDHLLGCQHQDLSEAQCDDGIPCTADVCDPVLGCTHEVVCPEYCDNQQDDDLDGKTDCADPDCKLFPACTGEGMCFPQGEVACKQQVSGDLDAPEASDLIVAYGCKAGSWAAPEQSWRFVPPCAGKVTVTVLESVSGSNPLLDAFVVPDQDGQCAGVNCQAYGAMTYIGAQGKAQALFNGVAGQTYYFIVDGRNEDTGTFTLSVACDCVP